MPTPELPLVDTPAPMPAVARVRPRRAIDRRWLAYLGFWLGTGLLLALAEWQHYVRQGLPHPWEPFLWELSSVSVIAALGVAIWRWDRRLMREGTRPAARAIGHVAGAAAFTLAHTSLMYALRLVVYRLAGVDYHPGTPAQVFGYEAAKDVVTYVIILAACHGLRVLNRAEIQAAALARLETQLAETRLAHLQSQIQPHFLFNTLNLISSVMYEDVDRADTLIAELADLLRQAEAAGRRPVHALADELRWAQPFLSIMRQRFGERLAVSVDVTPEAARCEVPSLLLMGPVENAVTHGVATSAGSVRVRIEAHVAGGWLDVRVVDESMSERPADARLQGGEARLAALDPPAPRGRGTGLANTRARLEAHHGDAQQVTLEREAARTVLRMRLPARPARVHGDAPAAARGPDHDDTAR
jgi:anti-sigma regulatory factor (Ser/Thr protein kinase)